MNREKFDKTFDALGRFGARYRDDAAVRARVAAGDLTDLDLEIPARVAVRVMKQSANTFYFPPPPAPAAALADEALAGGRRDYCFAGSSNPCLACACVT